MTAYLAGLNDLTLNLSDLMLSLHVVPELGPSEDLITGEQAHSVNLWVWISFRWKSSSNNVELSNLHIAKVSIYQHYAAETVVWRKHLPSSN